MSLSRLKTTKHMEFSICWLSRLKNGFCNLGLGGSALFNFLIWGLLPKFMENNNLTFFLSSTVSRSEKNSLTLARWTLEVPLYRLSLWTNKNPAFGHIACQQIRSLQVGLDLPDKPHVSVKSEISFRGRKSELISSKSKLWCKWTYVYVDN